MSMKIILLAGVGGSKMTPLNDRTAKCLLPVANRPLISYQLEMLERSGFNELMIITHDSALSGLKEFIKDKHSRLSIDYVTFKEEMGTAEALSKVKHKIKGDFVVVSGDLIVDPIAIQKLVERHREQEAMATILFSQPPPDDSQEKKKRGGEKPDYIGLDQTKKQLLCYFPSGEEESISFKRNLFNLFPVVNVCSNLIESHFYVFSLEALEKLEDRNFQSLWGDFIPYLCRAQFRKKKLEANLAATVEEAEVESGYNLHPVSVRCFCYVLDKGYCARVNTIESYLRVNREVATGIVGYLPLETKRKDNFIAEGAKVSQKTTIGSECVVGVSEVGDRTSVKKSVIGSHCKVGNNVKLVNSVLMDNVTVGDNCVIQNSVLCHGSVVGEKSSIENSAVGAGIKIPVESDIKNDKKGLN